MQTCIIKSNKSETPLMLLVLCKIIKKKIRKFVATQIYEWNLIAWSHLRFGLKDMSWHRTAAVLPSIPVAGGYGIYSREFSQKTLLNELVLKTSS